MSSPQAPDDHENGFTPDPSKQEAPETQSVVETVECPNCGRRFVGDYCPDCGEEATRTVRIKQVVSGAFGEVLNIGAGFDYESAFLSTLVGLTVRPGAVLREYLSGAQRKHMSPGRYLAVVVLLEFGVMQGLMQVGAIQSGPNFEGPFVTPAEGGEHQFSPHVTFDTSISQIAISLCLATFLTGTIWTAFRDRLRRKGEALAISFFVAAQGIVFGLVVNLLYCAPYFFSTGAPVTIGAGARLMAILIWLIYTMVLFALYFGVNWESLSRSFLSPAYALIEFGGFLVAFTAACGGFLVWYRPNKYIEDSVPMEEVFPDVYGAVGALAAIGMVPFAIHGMVELYYYWRR